MDIWRNRKEVVSHHHNHHPYKEIYFRDWIIFPGLLSISDHIMGTCRSQELRAQAEQIYFSSIFFIYKVALQQSNVPWRSNNTEQETWEGLQRLPGKERLPLVGNLWLNFFKLNSVSHETIRFHWSPSSKAIHEPFCLGCWQLFISLGKENQIKYPNFTLPFPRRIWLYIGTG